MSRRRILSAAGGAVAGGALATGAASGQPRVTRRAMIPLADELAEGDYADLFLHVGEKTPGELDASTLRNCTFSSWSPEGVTYRQGTLVDHIGDETQRVPSTVYTNEAEDLPTGSLWIINNTEQCPEGYVGLQLEQVGAAVEGNLTGTDANGDEGGAGAFGPGFGAVGVAAAAGVGGLLALLRGEKE